MPKLSVVLDTQIFLRGATARKKSLTWKIYQAWIEERYTLLMSKEILQEIIRVLSEPEVVRKLNITEQIFRQAINGLKERAEIVKVTSNFDVCRDPWDDKFLECAVDGKADFLVSTDNDLLDLGNFQGIPIIDIPTFWQRLEQR